MSGIRDNKYKLNRGTAWLVVSMLLIVQTFMCGCSDERITAFVNTDLIQIMRSRVDANKSIVDRLYISGLISESERDSIIKSIDAQMGAYLTEKLATNTSLQKKLLASVVDWSAPPWIDCGEGVNEYGMTEEEWENNVITTYIANNSSVASKLNMPLFKGKGKTITPLTIVDGDTGELINERLAYNVYVLKPFGDGGEDYIAGNISLDEMIEKIGLAVTMDGGEVQDKELSRYFQKAITKEGEAVTLLDVSKRENQAVVYSRGSTLVSDREYEYVNNKLKIKEEGNKILYNIEVNNVGFNTGDYTPRPGKDMVIRGVNDCIPLMSIRFREFNSEAIDTIESTLGMNPDQYLFSTGKKGSENRVYIMEYPIHYVSKIKEKEIDTTEFECEFEKSNVGINLRTGKLIKYGSAWGNDDDTAVYFEDSDPYLSVKGASGPHEEGRSAFVIERNTPIDYTMKVGEKQTEVSVGRILLRDYLEAVYAPGVVENEDMVVFGRKLRIMKFNGSKKDIIAKYYDKDGAVIDEGVPLYIDDFMDNEGIIGENKAVKYIGKIGEYAGENVGDTSENEEEAEIDSEDEDVGYWDIGASAERIEELNEEMVAEIYPTDQFPGITIGYVDYDNTNKPLFYTIAVRRSMFDTGLFNDWINKTDSDNNSLDWWLKWLGNMNRNYNYKINKNILEQYLARNYTFELQESGIVILNLETVSKIQQEYKEQDIINRNKGVRTGFVVFGYTIIGYALLLVMVWVVDTNIDLGFNLLGKVSLGQWIAVKDVSEIPQHDMEGRGYMDFRAIVVKATGLVVLGAILMLVNIIDIVIGVIDMFGGVARVIGKMITGR